MRILVVVVAFALPISSLFGQDYPRVPAVTNELHLSARDAYMRWQEYNAEEYRRTQLNEAMNEAIIRATQLEELQRKQQKLDALLAAKKAQEERERPQREAEMRRYEQELEYRREHPSPQFQAQLEAQARYEMHRREKTKQGDSTPTPALTPAPSASASPSPIANSQQQDSLGRPSSMASPQRNPRNE